MGTGIVVTCKSCNKKSQELLWEFPGGKIESGEAIADAIQRECLEELDIWPTKIAPLTVIEHEYTDKSVRLEVCLVSDYLGVPVGKEGQPLEWSPVCSLNNYDFPQANKAILKLL